MKMTEKKTICPEIVIAEAPFQCQRDGLTIRGTEYRPAGENLPIAVVSHGFTSTQEPVRDYTQFLAKMGFAAYCFDFCGGSAPGRGGTSDGATTDMSVLTEVKDLEAVVAYARSLSYTGDTLLLMGCSQGGFVSGLVAAKSEMKVDKLVMFYPALCIPDDARAGEMRLAQFDPKNIPDIIACGNMMLGSCYVTDVIDMDVYAEITPYNGPVLIVHGTADAIVSVDYAHKATAAYEASVPGRATLCIIEDGGHGFSPEHKAIAFEALRDFVK